MTADAVILATPKGQFTPVIDAKDDGLYVFKVVDERSQDPDGNDWAPPKLSAKASGAIGLAAERLLALFDIRRPVCVSASIPRNA